MRASAACVERIDVLARIFVFRAVCLATSQRNRMCVYCCCWRLLLRLHRVNSLSMRLRAAISANKLPINLHLVGAVKMIRQLAECADTPRMYTAFPVAPDGIAEPLKHSIHRTYCVRPPV